MNIVQTPQKLGRIYVQPKSLPLKELPCDIPGLTKRFTLDDDDNDYIFWDNQYTGGGYGTNGPTEFSLDDQEILLHQLKRRKKQKDKIVIVEIGVCRNEYNQTSTSILIDNKRDQDFYIGIDINDKSYLDNPSKNVYTIQSRSENFDTIYKFLQQHDIKEIDFLMIDGWHSVKQVYAEWTYTKLLPSQGIVVFHDTNAHPGPICILESIDTDQYDVYKYFTDLQDWGIGVAIKI